MPRLPLLLLVISSLLSVSAVKAALTVDADITETVNWTAAAGTVTVTKADFTVAEGGTLSIASGAIVNLVPATGNMTVNGVLLIQPGAVIRCYETVQLVVYGTVTCNGTADSMVTFDEYGAGHGWNGLYFRNSGTVHQSEFRHTAFNNQKRGTAVTEQHVTFDSCAFTAPAFVDRLFLRTWGGLDRHEDALLRITGSSFNVVSEYDCSSMGCARALIQLDGMDTEIEGNVMAYTASGENITLVNGIVGETSNTDPFTALVKDNSLMVAAQSGYVLCTAYGVNYSEYTMTGAVSGNDITVRTSVNGYGIYGYGGTPVTDNSVRVVKTVSGHGELYGIYSLYTGDDSLSMITGNTVALGTAADSVTAYIMTGIYMQAGTVRNNGVRIQYGVQTGTAKLYGVEKRYYPGRLVNNSFSIVHHSADDDVRGIYLGGHPNAADSIPVLNNIITGNGIADSRGIYRDGACVSLPVNAYNLVYGFDTAHSGLTAGPGLVTDAPSFTDSTLQLDIWSPAVDAGDVSMDYSNEPEPNGDRINMGAYGNTLQAARSVTDSFTVTVLPIPDSAGSVSGNGPYWYGDTARLAAVPAAGFGFTGWSAGTTIVSTDSAYAFVVLRSCSLAAHFEPVSGITASGPLYANQVFRILPDNGYFIWPTPGIMGRIVVTDVAGSVVIEQKDVRRSGRLDLDGLAAGVYVVSAYTGTAVTTVKLLKR